MGRGSGSWAWLAVALAGASFARAPAGVTDDIPETILREREQEHEPPPDVGVELTPISDYLWVSAEAIDRLGLDVLMKPSALWVEKRLAASSPTDPCVDLGVSVANRRARDARLGDLAEMARDSTTIVEGTVKGHRAGFYGGSSTPGFLLAVDVESVMAYTGDSPAPGDTLLALYPGPGDFEMLDRRFCGHAPGFPEVPAPGDRVLIFSGRDEIADPNQPITLHNQPITLYSENFVIERARDGAIALPRKLEHDPAMAGLKTLAAVRAEVEHHRLRR